MGVITTADESVEKARELIAEAYSQLVRALDPQTWGHDDFNTDYVDKLHEVALGLLQIKRKLK